MRIYISSKTYSHKLKLRKKAEQYEHYKVPTGLAFTKFSPQVRYHVKLPFDYPVWANTVCTPDHIFYFSVYSANNSLLMFDIFFLPNIHCVEKLIDECLTFFFPTRLWISLQMRLQDFLYNTIFIRIFSSLITYVHVIHLQYIKSIWFGNNASSISIHERLDQYL